MKNEHDNTNENRNSGRRLRTKFGRRRDNNGTEGGVTSSTQESNHANPKASSNRMRSTNARAKQAVERYLSLARDAFGNGDRIAAEGYLQHADHYYRVAYGSTTIADEKTDLVITLPDEPTAESEPVLPVVVPDDESES